MILFIDLDKNKDKGVLKGEYLDTIREHFSIKDTKANLKKKLFKTRFIADRIYCITQSGRFEIGLLPDIIRFLKTLNTPFKIILSEEFKERYKTSYNFEDGLIYPLAIEPRDYQLEGLKRGLQYGSGIYLFPTGSGKTLLMAMLIHNISKRIDNTKVLLVTLTHLIDQIYDEFVDYGINPKDICKWSGTNELNPNSKVVICGTNILYNKIDNLPLEIKKAKIVYLTLQKKLKEDLTLNEVETRKLIDDSDDVRKQIERLERRVEPNQKVHEYLKSINLFLLDECHTIKKDNKLDDFFKFLSTRQRFLFTGTLPESKIDEWNLIGKSGPVIHDVERKELVERKYITDVDVRILKIFYKNPNIYFDGMIDDTEKLDEDLPTANYQLEIDYIIGNQFRNNIIKKIVEKTDKNILITVDRILHGEILYKLFSDTLQNKQIYFIRGKTEDEERNEIKKLMECNTNVVCIAITKIFSTGINIKNLHYIMFASSGKAKTKIIQTIGRGVRKLEGKEKVVIFDIADMLLYNTKHLESRLILYDNEGIKHKTTEIKEI